MKGASFSSELKYWINLYNTKTTQADNLSGYEILPITAANRQRTFSYYKVFQTIEDKILEKQI